MNEIIEIEQIDKIIGERLRTSIDSLEGYVFEGSNYNRPNFERLLLFYIDELFELSELNISDSKRWINTYFWYTQYLVELKKQKLSISNHRQARFKVLERIGNSVDADYNWSFIESIDEQLEQKAP